MSTLSDDPDYFNMSDPTLNEILENYGIGYPNTDEGLLNYAKSYLHQQQYNHTPEEILSNDFPSR